MTKIQRKTKQKIMHSHNHLSNCDIDKAFAFIDLYLPEKYVNLVSEKVSATSNVIRNVRNRNTKYPSNHTLIIKALVEVAKENKESIEFIKELT
ncbi:hypothetical protein SAMN05216480_1055 [Pustulibacterium marinum]|uniref:Uncharacterized protein n=1 Tax=Pustulibacterium marinum TaxID=1224947 RepID=A0A1I7GJM4_9FLAO|nr:hypothetical protein [Pustulibacterium marinum]SFU48640.1 hypothetical protein SAMN05216480_1055 [Pustulibacterium marinum]